jgi:hypothetical protein
MVQHHIVDIVHIDENMTRLIDFHGLGSTFSDRMRTKGFAIYSTHNSRTGKLSIFWSTSKTSQQKRQVLGDLRLFKRVCFAGTFGLFCLFAVFHPNPN